MKRRAIVNDVEYARLGAGVSIVSWMQPSTAVEILFVHYKAKGKRSSG